MAEDEDPEGHEVEESEPQDAEKGPLRRCIVTRESLAKEDMLRFVVGPENSLVPDLAGRLPGRGMWLKAAPGVLEQALKKGAFHRAAKAQVKMPENFAAVLASMLEQRLVDMLGMARRAGESVAGWQKVQEWLVAGEADRWPLHAGGAGVALGGVGARLWSWRCGACGGGEGPAG